KDDLVTRVKDLNIIMNAYKDKASLDRTRVRQIAPLQDIYPDLTAVIVYPPFRIQEVLKLCGEGHLFPAGVTRFTVAPRALRINYPLEEMSSARSLEEKNAKLNQWLKERMARKGVRFYAEPTVLFDE
ncbi:MAG: hypothetical protein OEY93_06820, partial [Anaerolineae bacterium]|nr:hypothetical protein [Anaerolineae bacterium]